jgi:hypothetical protein
MQKEDPLQRRECEEIYFLSVFSLLETILATKQIFYKRQSTTGRSAYFQKLFFCLLAYNRWIPLYGKQP